MRTVGFVIHHQDGFARPGVRVMLRCPRASAASSPRRYGAEDRGTSSCPCRLRNRSAPGRPTAGQSHRPSKGPARCPGRVGLVVKNGSKARAITSGVMPVPVSLTHSETYCPGGDVALARGARRSSHLLPVSMVSRPPSGMASRALMQRLSSAFSSWRGIDQGRPQPAAPTTSTAIAGPTVRRTSSSMPAISRLTSVRLADPASGGARRRAAGG